MRRPLGQRRVVEGVPHYVKIGEKVLTETGDSDALLLGLLRTHRPGRFGDDGIGKDFRARAVRGAAREAAGSR